MNIKDIKIDKCLIWVPLVMQTTQNGMCAFNIWNENEMQELL